MHYYIVETTLGYAGTDNHYLVESEDELSQEAMDSLASEMWWSDFDSSGAVFGPEVEEQLDVGEITEEEAEEIYDSAHHGMVVHEVDCYCTQITKDNLEEMIKILHYETHDWSEEKEAEIRKSFE